LPSCLGVVQDGGPQPVVRDTEERGVSPDRATDWGGADGERADAATEEVDGSLDTDTSTGERSVIVDRSKIGSECISPTTSNSDVGAPPSSHSQAREADANLQQTHDPRCTTDRAAAKPVASVSKQLLDEADTTANHDVPAAAVVDGVSSAREALAAIASWKMGLVNQQSESFCVEKQRVASTQASPPAPRRRVMYVPSHQLWMIPTEGERMATYLGLGPDGDAISVHDQTDTATRQGSWGRVNTRWVDSSAMGGSPPQARSRRISNRQWHPPAPDK